MQALRPHSDLPSQELWVWGPAICVLHFGRVLRAPVNPLEKSEGCAAQAASQKGISISGWPARARAAQAIPAHVRGVGLRTAADTDPGRNHRSPLAVWPVPGPSPL